jgi:hypothetical protein
MYPSTYIKFAKQQQPLSPRPGPGPVALFQHRWERASLHVDSTISLPPNQTILWVCGHGNPYIGANEPITIPPQLPHTIYTVLQICTLIPSSHHNPYNQLIHIYSHIYDANALPCYHDAHSHIFLILHTNDFKSPSHLHCIWRITAVGGTYVALVLPQLGLTWLRLQAVASRKVMTPKSSQAVAWQLGNGFGLIRNKCNFRPRLWGYGK